MKVLIFLLIVGLSVSGPIEDLQPGQWYEVPNSNMSQVDAEDDPACNPNYPSDAPWHGVGGLNNIMGSWSSGAYDTKRDKFIIWGGGHHGYAGNEIYVFDINTLQWERVNCPSNPPADDVPYASDGGPCSRHTYDYIDYIPDIDRFCSFGGSGFYNSGQTGTNHTDCFDFDSKTWEQKSDAIGQNWISACTGYDPVTKTVLLKTSRVSQWDITSDSWTQRYDWLASTDYTRTCDVDINNRCFICLGRDEVISWDLTVPSPAKIPKVTLSTTGATSIVNANYPGFVYEPVTEEMIAWDGGQDLYTLDVATEVWTRHSGGGDNPGSPNGTGTNGRFRYVPSKNVFILVNTVSTNVFIYRHTADTHAPNWYLDLFGIDTTSVSQGNLPVSASGPVLQVHPNPVTSMVKIAVSFQPSAISKKTVPIKIFGVNGKMVKKLTADSRQLTAGITWHTSRLPAGIYILKTKIGTKTLTRRIFKL
jgi:hypothetical protein